MIKEHAIRHFNEGSLIVVSDMSHHFHRNLFFVSTLFLHKDKSFLVQGCAQSSLYVGLNLEIIGLDLAIKHLLSSNPAFVSNVNMSNVVLIIDQGRDSFSGNLENSLRKLAKNNILLRAKSHVCPIHGVCDKLCHQLAKEITPSKIDAPYFFTLRELSAADLSKNPNIFRPVSFFLDCSKEI